MNGRTNPLVFVSCRTLCHMTPLQQKQNYALCMFEVHAGNFHGCRIHGCRSSLCTQENREKTVDFTLLNNPDIKRNRLKGTVTPSMLLLLCTVTSPAVVHWLLLTVEKVAGVIPSPSCVCSPSLTQVKVLHSQVIGNSTSAVGASANACLLWILTFYVASWSEIVNIYLTPSSSPPPPECRTF